MTQTTTFGDRIKFDRGTYSHWALYIGDGKVIQLNPKNCPEKVGVLEMNMWYDGDVTIEDLMKVAGSDKYSVARNNFSGGRPANDIKLLVEITTTYQMFKYCLVKFNCEHFTNFLKYGQPFSSQTLFLDSITGKRVLELGLLGPRVTPANLLTLGESMKPKLKTWPTSTDPTERKREFIDICQNVAKKVQTTDSQELAKQLFGI